MVDLLASPRKDPFFGTVPCNADLKERILSPKFLRQITQQICPSRAIPVQAAEKQHPMGIFLGARAWGEAIRIDTVGDYTHLFWRDAIGFTQILLQVLADCNGACAPTTQAVKKPYPKVGVYCADQRNSLPFRYTMAKDSRKSSVDVYHVRRILSEKSPKSHESNQQSHGGMLHRNFHVLSPCQKPFLYHPSADGCDGDLVSSLQQSPPQGQDVRFRPPAIQRGVYHQHPHWLLLFYFIRS